ncbi:phosphopyruvate hydratase [Candidatus Woesearchaeota archaeon]|nr:phosphopyruvate hydratase [Candidatus Woesearchaeota archaeon]
MGTKITKVHGRQILDSRGNPTVEVDVYADKFIGRASVPSGASVGIYEAVELRDNTKAFHGKSVLTAVHNVNTILAKKIIGKDVLQQQQIDELMATIDGTENKSRLGANSILAVSLAVARCGSTVRAKPLYASLGQGTTLPIPFSNVINGGRHAEGNLKIQEFMIAPIKAKSFAEATQMVSEAYQSLKEIIMNKYGKTSTHVGDEGGFAPPVYDPHDAINLLLRAIEESGYQDRIKIALDVAASEFYDRKVQKYTIEQKKLLGRDELTEYYLNLLKMYPIISIEDPFDQDDFHSYEQFMKKVKVQVVGDDLLATNPERVKLANTKGLCNALLLKVNQVGTLTEALHAADLAFKNKWKVMVSHRSGETADSFIADLAVALNCGQIKLGAPCRGERTEKFNQLLRIEEELGKKAKYAKF